MRTETLEETTTEDRAKHALQTKPAVTIFFLFLMESESSHLEARQSNRSTAVVPNSMMDFERVQSDCIFPLLCTKVINVLYDFKGITPLLLHAKPFPTGKHPRILGDEALNKKETNYIISFGYINCHCHGYVYGQLFIF